MLRLFCRKASQSIKYSAHKKNRVLFQHARSHFSQLNHDNFANGTSASLLESLYEQWRKDPKSVDDSWSFYFNQIQNVSLNQAQSVTSTSEADLHKHVRVLQLLRNFRIVGHLAANLDPLKLQARKIPPELNYQYYGLTEQDLDKEYKVFDSPVPINGTLRQVLQFLQNKYCNTIGWEFSHIYDTEQREWLRQKIETTNYHITDPETYKTIYEYLSKVHKFESYLHKKFGNTKRFGCEGGESMIPGLKPIVFSKILLT